MAYGRRWEELVKARSQLSLELLEAEVLWGEAIRAPEKLLIRCIGDLWLAVHRHLQDPSSFRETEQNFQKRLTILYEDDPDTNEFTKRVADVIQEFERILRPHIGARHA